MTNPATDTPPGARPLNLFLVVCEASSVPVPILSTLFNGLSGKPGLRGGSFSGTSGSDCKGHRQFPGAQAGRGGASAPEPEESRASGTASGSLVPFLVQMDQIRASAATRMRTSLNKPTLRCAAA